MTDDSCQAQMQGLRVSQDLLAVQALVALNIELVEERMVSFVILVILLDKVAYPSSGIHVRFDRWI